MGWVESWGEGFEKVGVGGRIVGNKEVYGFGEMKGGIWKGCKMS